MTKVCIVGASGKLGRYMVQHALDLARTGVTTVDEAMGLAGWME